MKIMMTVGPEVIVNKEQWSYDECIFFSFLKHFLEFRFPVIVDFAVLMLICSEILPIMEIGFLANRIRPLSPMYLLLQPADQSRIEYSNPKKDTKTTS